jgi:hypothetical protein
MVEILKSRKPRQAAEAEAGARLKAVPARRGGRRMRGDVLLKK